MPETAARIPRRSHALANRARILATARQELGRDPDTSLDEIARAAGVVRRTVYGYFPSRRALIEALAEEATQALEEAFTAARDPKADPATAAVRMTLAAWEVGDRYRMLISIGRRDLGEERVRAALGPIREEATRIVARGQQDGTFADHLSAPIIAWVLEGLVLALIEYEGADGGTSPTAADAAIASLVAAGVTPASAKECVQAVLGRA